MPFQPFANQPATTNTPTSRAPSLPTEKSFLSKIGSGVVGLGRNIIEPVNRFGEGLGAAAGAVATGGQFEKNQQQYLDISDRYTKKAIELSKQGRKAEADQLFKLSQETLSKAGAGATERIEMAEKGKEDVVKGGVGTAGLIATPGGGSSFLGKVAAGSLGGATAGYGVSKKGEELESTLGGAVLGAGLSGAGHLGGKAASKLGLTGAGKKITKTGKGISQSTRQIKLKAEVGGAQKEELVNQVLDDLGFKGTPQQQYEMLQPKMTQLEKTLRSRLKKNPLEFNLADVSNEIMTQLDDQGYLIGSKNKSRASQALNDVMDDVIGKKAKGGRLTSTDLFNVKQRLNKIAQRIEGRIDRGIQVKPEDEVLVAARDALDDVIGKYHPDVKGMTLAQSALFDAARPLSSARSNAPTLRAFGTSIPSIFTIRGQQLLGGVTQGSGKGISGIGKVTGDIAESPIARNLFLSKLVGAAGGTEDFEGEADQVQKSLDQQGGYQESYSPTEGGEEYVHEDIIPEEAQTLNPYGATADELGQLYALALQSGDKEAISQLKTLYDLETEYQKTTSGGTGASGKIPASGARDLGETQSAYELVSNLSPLIDTYADKMGPIQGRLSGANPYDTDTQAFDAKMKIAAQIVGKALEGGKLTDPDIARYRQMLPNITDTPALAKKKLENVLSMLEDRYSVMNQAYQKASPDIIGSLAAEEGSFAQ